MIQINGVSGGDAQGRMLFTLDYWSVPQLAVVAPAGAANQALPDVVIAAIPTGAVITKATARQVQVL